MKQYLLIVLFLSTLPVTAQVKKIDSKIIYVDYSNTTHLIFPADIKYFSSIEDIIICARTEVQNVLSVKAAKGKRQGATTLSVVTADGKFHSFEVHGVQHNTKTSYYVKNDSTGTPKRLNVNTLNDLHLLFPSPVKYIDYGSKEIEAVPAPDVQNIVRVSTFDAFENTTNVSVITADKQFFTFALNYDETEKNYSFLVGDLPREQTAILAQEDLTDNSKEEILDRLKQHGAKIHDLGVKKNSILFSIQNIFIFNNKLIFRYNLQNKSNIKYDIDYMRFYIVDKKQAVEGAEQEVVFEPLFLDNYKATIAGKQDNTYSVCFEKFTIPDKKYFVIEINEKNGGRHIVYKIRNNEIERAKNL